jgi:Spy/CpxP family protein refolding chaperone
MIFQPKRFNRMLVVFLALCVIAASPGSLTAKASADSILTDQTPDLLGRLKQALSDAGATALTTAQETALTTLIEDFRAANESSPSATRLAYDNYILSAEADQAMALIPTLQSEQSAQALARAQAESTFAVNAVKILLTSQLTLLKQSLGIDELVRLIQSLAGGPGGGGHSGPPMK